MRREIECEARVSCVTLFSVWRCYRSTRPHQKPFQVPESAAVEAQSAGHIKGLLAVTTGNGQRAVRVCLACWSGGRLIHVCGAVCVLPSVGRLLSNPRRPKRKVAKVPYKVLDAPALQVC
jgi:hypothetical protein